MNLAGKVSLVTGGAHRVGRAIALALARAGSSVAIHYGSSEEAAQETAEDLRSLGVEAWTFQGDLSQPAAIRELLAEVGSSCPHLDVVVNSAASFKKRPFADIDAEEWNEVLAVNLRAPFLVTREAAPLLRASLRPTGEAAAVVNMVDLSATLPWPGYAHHGVSKAGLLHLTRQAARELGPQIRVNAIAPGAILPPPGMEADSEEWREVGHRLPVGTTGHPDQVGDTAVFLASNDFITGTVITVDGGEHLLGAGHR
jgi:NAD(P)-dependent dehydrogenase (short-subunit alcohol dehydrogenase family)